MALTGGRRAIGEHVAQVAAAARTHDLVADHAMAGIAHRAHVRCIERREETRPAGARVELGAGAEQRQPAEPAGVDAIEFVVEEHTAERGLGAVFEQDAAFVGAESGAEFATLCIARWAEVEVAHAGSSMRAAVADMPLDDDSRAVGRIACAGGHDPSRGRGWRARLAPWRSSNSASTRDATSLRR